MSGLATIGGTVGAGAVGGLGILGGAGGLAAASLVNNTLLKDDASLNNNERSSRSMGRKASYAGAAAGTAGSIAAVAAVGVPGLSAVGITTGLAAIGSTVGGGMAAGVGHFAIPAKTLSHQLYRKSVEPLRGRIEIFLRKIS